MEYKIFAIKTMDSAGSQKQSRYRERETLVFAKDIESISKAINKGLLTHMDVDKYNLDSIERYENEMKFKNPVIILEGGGGIYVHATDDLNRKEALDLVNEV